MAVGAKMLCRYCKKTISFPRRLFDREFCTAKHRNAGSARSARVLREVGEWDYSAVEVASEIDDYPAPVAKRKAGAGAQSTAAVLGLAAAAIAGLVIIEKTGSGATPGRADSRSGAGKATVTRFLDKVIDRLPKSAGGVVMEDRFQTGLRHWLPAAGSGQAGWRSENGLIRPGGLRIWDESRNLGDYSFQFEGRVESKSLGWVVRASNHKNYYATKLVLPERGAAAGAEIVRFSVIQGQESRRLRFPVPVSLEREQFYSYEVRAVGNRILTIVGGRVVDEWRDTRFRKGGVGFFSERGDKSSIRWAKLEEGERIADKLRGFLTFGLLLPVV